MDHCTKCNGFGFLPQHLGIRNGECFRCKGKNTRGMTYHSWQGRVAAVERTIVQLKRIISNREQFFKSLSEQPIQNEEERAAYEQFRQDYKTKKTKLKELEQEQLSLQLS